jgi:hypothetical protein
MTDEQQPETTTAKRPPGRPKGSIKRRNANRAPMHEPVHQGRTGGDEPDMMENFEYKPFEAQDALAIDFDTVLSIEREWGYSLLWVMFECVGKPFPDRVNWRKRNGYAEVTKGNFDGALDHLCDKDGRITKEGLVLMARPVQIQKMAQAHEERAAKHAIEQMKRSHMEEGVDVSMPGGGKHPGARAKNMHRQTFEPVKIPD